MSTAALQRYPFRDENPFKELEDYFGRKLFLDVFRAIAEDIGDITFHRPTRDAKRKGNLLMSWYTSEWSTVKRYIHNYIIENNDVEVPASYVKRSPAGKNASLFVKQTFQEFAMNRKRITPKYQIVKPLNIGESGVLEESNMFTDISYEYLDFTDDIETAWFL